MKRSALLLVGISLLLVSVNIRCIAQDFTPYPGSKLDDKDSRDASAAAPGKESKVYTTGDTFDQVYAFYKGHYKEHTMRHGPPPLSSGQQIKWAFFILDGGKDLVTSKYWMKIQRPYVRDPEGKDIRDVTVIQTVRSK